MKKRHKILVGLIAVILVLSLMIFGHSRSPDKVLAVDLIEGCIEVSGRYIERPFSWFTWIFANSELDDSSTMQNLSVPIKDVANKIDGYFVLRPSYEINVLVHAQNEKEQAAYKKATLLEEAWNLSGKFKGCEPHYDEEVNLWRLYMRPSCDTHWIYLRERPDPQTLIPGLRDELFIARCHHRKIEGVEHIPDPCNGEYAVNNIRVNYHFLLPNIHHIAALERVLKEKIVATCN